MTPNAASATNTTSSADANNAKGRSVLDRPVPGLTIATSFIIWLGFTTIVLPQCVVNKKHLTDKKEIGGQGLNLLAYLILFFNNLNILISVCEIMLGRHIQYIKQHYQRLKQHYTAGVDEYQACFAYLNMPLSVREALFLSSGGQQKWAQMWSTYSLWDPSYQNDESFGFFIDVGNGWSTIPINVMWNIMILCPQYFVVDESDVKTTTNTYVMALAFVGTASYWQVLYGTIIYLLSFVWNRRYVGKPLVEVLGFVGFANGLWFVFPIFCLWASYQLLVTQDPTAVFYCDR